MSLIEEVPTKGETKVEDTLDQNDDEQLLYAYECRPIGGTKNRKTLMSKLNNYQNNLRKFSLLSFCKDYLL